VYNRAVCGHSDESSQQCWLLLPVRACQKCDLYKSTTKNILCKLLPHSFFDEKTDQKVTSTQQCSFRVTRVFVQGHLVDGVGGCVAQCTTCIVQNINHNTYAKKKTRHWGEGGNASVFPGACCRSVKSSEQFFDCLTQKAPVSRGHNTIIT